MTMLDRMRRHRDWLKWSLGLVCVAFVLFYIPDFLKGTGADAASSDTIAKVEGHEITAGEFRRTYQAQVQAYRSAYGANMNDQLLKQLGIEQQILQQMVDERAALAEAERLGVTVSDEEVRQRIFAMPAFQENGGFIGEQRYQQLLRMQRPPMMPSEFETNVRRGLTVEKLRASLTDWLAVPDKELEEAYRRRNDKIKLAVVTFNADSFRGQATASDADVASHFEAHKNDFKIPEKRKIRYVLLDIEAMRGKVVVPPADIEKAYNSSIEQYTTPEQVRASHILLKTEGKTDADVKAKAEAILKQAKAGADFAELAKKNSEDESNAKNGGDLDYFGRGRMVPEFDQAVFAMQPGPDQRSRQDAVRLPHHQTGGQEKRGDPLAGGGPAAADRSARLRTRAGASRCSGGEAREAGEQARGSRQGCEGRRAHRAGVRLLRARGTDSGSRSGARSRQ